MNEKYMMLPLNRLSEVRMFNFRLPQLGMLILSLSLALSLSASIGRHAKIYNLPLDVLIFIGIFSISLLPVSMFDVRPLTWWKRLIQVKTKSTIPFSLPHVHSTAEGEDASAIGDYMIDGTSHHCLKIDGDGLKDLEPSNRQQIFDLLIDAANGCDGLQMFCSSVGLKATDDRAFYVVASGESTSRNSLFEKLKRAGFTAQILTTSEFRQLIYKHLSPSHAQANSILPEPVEHVSDLITLAVSGFAQNADHMSIDGQYSRTVCFEQLPTASYFGILNRFVEADSDLALAVHFHACDPQALRASLRRNFHLGLIQSVPSIEPRALVAELSEFIRGETSSVDVSLYVTVYADSLESLDSKVDLVHGIAQRVNARVRVVTLEQLDGLISVLPLGLDKLQARQTITTKAAATLFPFAR